MKLIPFLITTLALLIGCTAPQIEQSADEYLRLAQLQMDDKDYSDAAISFEMALLASDTPEQAKSAQLGLANANYHSAENAFLSFISVDETKYLNAIAAYEIYYDLYEGDENSPLVLYRLGEMYSKIALHPRTDQTFTKSSVDYFEQLKSLYPQNFDDNASAIYSQMLENLAEHEYQVAKYYMRIDKPESAVQRLVYLLNNYPGTTKDPLSLAMLTEIFIETPGKTSTARDYLSELKARFPGDKSLPRLEKLLSEKENWNIQ
jgi:outer membrane protein assembly factor BamD